MAKLILTDKEKSAPFWNDLDDEALGRAVKYYGAKFLTSERDDDNNAEGAMDMVLKAATVGMACHAHEMGVTEWTISLAGVTLKGEGIGDWEIAIRRVDAEVQNAP